MRIQKVSGNSQERSHINALSLKENRILRSEVILMSTGVGSSSRKEDIEFRLGDHPIAGVLRQLPLGDITGYTYTPKGQGVLTSVIESYPVKQDIGCEDG
jgi:hypothetical protein